MQKDTVGVTEELKVEMVDCLQEYERARMVEPDWQGGIEPLQQEIKRLREELAKKQ
jgi:hypothetical protein